MTIATPTSRLKTRCQMKLMEKSRMYLTAQMMKWTRHRLDATYLKGTSGKQVISEIFECNGGIMFCFVSMIKAVEVHFQ
jgi:Holliday junction resolvase-like predicted endonuclease